MEGRGALAIAGAVTLALLAGLAPLWLVPAPSATRSAVYNLDPAFGDPNNDLVWDPNFIPGFAGTPGVHLTWTDPAGGPGTIDYFVGPWPNASVAGYPHFAVGPQAFNFLEVPRTQVFRSPAWGDYGEVRQGFAPCAVNLGNVTVNASAAVHPIYVGLPVAQTAWTVDLPLTWAPPTFPTAYPAAGELALVATLSLPPLPGQPGARLVYVNLVLWSTPPVSAGISPVPGNPLEGDVGGGTFSLDALPAAPATRSYSVDLSTYLDATLTGLGLPIAGALLSYVYVEAAGYNVHLHVSFPSLALIGPAPVCGAGASPTAGAAAAPSVSGAVAAEARATRRGA